MEDRFPPVLAAFEGACHGVELTEKAGAFHSLEAAIALERACSALELAAEATRACSWVKELHFRWRSTSAYGGSLGLKILPSLGESRDSVSLGSLGANSELAAIIEFSIAATHLADGGVKADAPRSHSDSMRAAFQLATRDPTFSGRAAAAFQTKLDLAERELARALAWACHSDSVWLPSASVAGANWEKTASREQAESSQEMAALLGWPALAAEIERRIIRGSAHDPATARQRRGL